MTAKKQTTAKGKKTNLFSRMVFIVLKSNRMQAGALAVTYILTFALLVLLGFFYPSIEKTFDTYLEDYRLPEATVLTSAIPKEAAKEAADRDGVSAFSLRVVLEAQTHFPNGKTVGSRYSSVPEESEIRYADVYTKADVKLNAETAMISSYFARQNHISSGDVVSVKTPLGTKDITITDIVSSPETISTDRDDFAWYDSNDFALLFLSEPLMDELFSTGNTTNRIDLWFEDGADAAGLLAKIEDQLGQAVISAGMYEGSKTQKQIESSLEATRAVVTYMPVLLVGMGILFSTLFFIQIVNRGEQQNGLLLALGYDARKISLIYVRCAVILSLCSSVGGFALGAALLRVILQIYVSTYDLPFLSYDGSLLLLPVLLIVIMLIGVISSLLSCLRLGNLDPVQIFHSGSSEQKRNLPGWIHRMKINIFFKMSLCNIYRSSRRFALSVLCGVACLVLTFLAFSVIASKNESIRYLFEDRFRYDLSIRCSSEEALAEIASLPGIKRSEKIIEMAYEYEDETMLIQALPEHFEMISIMSAEGETLSLPSDGSIMIEEGFARRHNLSAGDQMTVNDLKLTVQAITREYYHSVQYISLNTAAQMGIKENTNLLLALETTKDIPDFISETSETEGYAYYVDRESREDCVRSILSSLDLPCYVFALFSIVIGAVIVSTMNLITIAQRRRKYSTLHVLGTTLADFLSIELPEVLLQFLATVLLGWAPAIVCARIILRQMSAPSQEFVLVDPLRTVLLSSAVVAIYLFIGVLVTIGAIRRMDHLKVLAER